jgi:hypothetical protein
VTAVRLVASTITIGSDEHHRGPGTELVQYDGVLHVVERR